MEGVTVLSRGSKRPNTGRLAFEKPFFPNAFH
jgi:hypothetical protein